jgi:siroheme synthase (precorrin-2 oxidase/ferrochelatase)
MDWLDKTKNVIIGTGKVAKDKAKEMLDVADLKAQVSTCDEVIRKNLIAIGKKYIELHKDEVDEEFAEFVQAVKDAEHGKHELEKQIQERKNQTV